MESQCEYDVFLSYSRPDAEAAEDLARTLTETGLTVWFDKWFLVPGQSWRAALEQAVQSAASTIVCVGASGVGPGQQNEYQAALQMQVTDSRPMILVLFPGAEPRSLPSFLRDLVWVDLRDGINNARQLSRLVSAIESGGAGGEIAQQQRMGENLRAAGNLGEAIVHYEQALRTARAAYGDDHPKTSDLLVRLASVKQESGHLSGALADLEQSRRVASAAFGDDSQQVATVFNSLGSVRRDLGDIQVARTYFERALVISWAKLGPNHPVVATRLSNLGSVLRDLGDIESARACFVQALEIDRRSLGLDHPVVATRLSNLGSVLHDLGDVQAARGYFEKALEISRRLLGPNHPTVATNLSNLGSVLRDLGDIKLARIHFEQALEVDRRSLGPDHPIEATRLSNLGSVLRDLGDILEARTYFEQALEIGRRLLGPDHPTVATNLSNLGSVLRDLGDIQLAGTYFEQALDIDRRALGSNHPTVAITINNLAGTFLARGERQMALASYQKAHKILSSSMGADHSLTRAVFENLQRASHEGRGVQDLNAVPRQLKEALQVFPYEHQPKSDLPGGVSVQTTSKSLDIEKKFVGETGLELLFRLNNHAVLAILVNDQAHWLFLRKELKKLLNMATIPLAERLRVALLNRFTEGDLEAEEAGELLGVSVDVDDMQTASALVELGAPLMLRVDQRGESVLHRAAIVGDVDRFKSVLAVAPFALPRDNWGRRPSDLAPESLAETFRVLEADMDDPVDMKASTLDSSSIEDSPPLFSLERNGTARTGTGTEMAVLHQEWNDDWGAIETLDIRFFDLPFQPDSPLIELRPFFSSATTGRLCFLLQGDKLHKLDGTSPPIHEVNSKIKPLINQETVLHYLSFFCFFVRGQDGPFLIVDSRNNEFLPELGERKSDFDSISRPPRVWGRNERGFWRVSGLVYYSYTAFLADFIILPSGLVEMVNDTPVLTDLPAIVNAPLEIR